MKHEKWELQTVEYVCGHIDVFPQTPETHRRSAGFNCPECDKILYIGLLAQPAEYQSVYLQQLYSIRSG